jgi:hypothetical protein
MEFTCGKSIDIAQPLAENDPDEGIRRTAVRFLEGLELYPASARN